MSSPRVRLAEMSPEQRAAAKGSPVATVKAIHGHGKRGQPSKVERDYGSRLESLRMAGELRSVTPQPDPIVLPARDSVYVADFRTVLADGSVQWVECKGRQSGPKGRPFFHDRESKLKVKLAARLLSERTPPESLVLVWPKKGGGWNVEKVRP